jgi:hypothetical protein
MDRDWVRFFELVERLQAVSPGLAELAVRYGQNKDREVLEEVERELGHRSAGEISQEPFLDRSQKINLRRCQDFLGDLRKQEAYLREVQVKTTQDLLQVQAAKRAFEETLKEMLRAERRSFAADEGAELHASEEEVVAGLQELKDKGGLELHEFIGGLEQLLHDRERNGK